MARRPQLTGVWELESDRELQNLAGMAARSGPWARQLCGRGGRGPPLDAASIKGLTRYAQFSAEIANVGR
jgi:hypothetical protein